MPVCDRCGDAGPLVRFEESDGSERFACAEDDTCLDGVLAAHPTARLFGAESVPPTHPSRPPDMGGRKPDASGKDRDVYYIGEDLVLKVGAGQHGRSANRTEMMLWHKTGDSGLCPILAGDPAGRWVVMPRVAIGQGSTLEAAEIGERLGVGDIWSFNQGRYQGRTVIVDYAH